MMRLFTNNASTTLASPISNVALSMTVATGDGAKFPNPTGSDYFMATLYRIAAGEELDIEIVKCTARSGDVLTIQRGHEGTTAVAHASGDLVGLRVTAATMAAHEALVDSKDKSGGIAGLTLLKINFLNALGTFVSFFTNANTAARTYTFQDRDGTIADNTDLALKADKAGASFTGNVSVTYSGASPALKVTQTGTGNAFVIEDEASDTTPFVIDQNGRALFGQSTAISTLFGNTSGVQINAQFGTQALAVNRFSNNAFGADIDFVKSRNAVVGGHTVLQSGDQISNLNFIGSDGTSFLSAASIAAIVDSTPGTNDMPGRLVFSTTADGSSTPVERMRINSAGNLLVGGTTDTGEKLQVTGNAKVSGNIELASGAPVLYFTETDQTLPEGKYRLVISGGAMFFQKNTAAAGDYSTTLSPWYTDSTGALYTVDPSVALNNNRVASTAYVVSRIAQDALAKTGGTLTGSVREAKTAMAANAIDCALGGYFSKTISGATTLTVSNVSAANSTTSFILDLTNGGSAAITWWTGVKWSGGTAPTLTAAGRDVLGFFTHDGGTTWTGLVLGKDVK